MQDRIRDLKELEKQIRTAGFRRPTPGRTSGGPVPGPGRPGRARAQSFDLGQVISLRYGDVHARPMARPRPVGPAAKRLLAQQRSVFVGAFEEGTDESDAQAEPAEEQEQPEDGGQRAAWPEEQEEEPDTDAATEENEARGETGVAAGRAQSRPQAATRPPRPTAAHAEQIAAFQKEVEALSARRPGQGATAPAPSPAEEAPGDEGSGSTPPRRAGGHEVFEDMARGMEYASEFRLPPVDVQRLFRDLDQQIDTAAGRLRREPGATTAGAASAPIPMPDDDVLARDLASLDGPAADPERASRLLADQLGTGALRRFKPEEILIGEDDARAVFKFFWPALDPAELGALTDTDRSYAQALLIEAADSSHSVGIVETLYRTFYGKVATDFDAVKEMLKTVAKKAIEDKWFQAIETLKDAEGQQIYESVRAALAAKQRSTYETRRQTGELTGY